MFFLDAVLIARKSIDVIPKAATSPPLCLDPDPLITRIVNTSLRDSAISPPAAFKRKQDAVNSEKDDAAKAQEGKIMALMNPHVARQMTAP